MERTIILVSLLIAGTVGYSQQKTASAEKRVTDVSPIGFHSSLVQGKLTLNKSLLKNAGGDLFTPSYEVVALTDSTLLNNGKPVSVQLTQQSFESLFTKTTPALAAKWAFISNYVKDKKLQLTEESGWIAALGYFNLYN